MPVLQFAGSQRFLWASRGGWLETKPFAVTSEFWLTVVGIASVLIAGYVIKDPAFNLFRAWLLAMVIAGAYILSRGLAKSGSHTDHSGGI